MMIFQFSENFSMRQSFKLFTFVQIILEFLHLHVILEEYDCTSLNYSKNPAHYGAKCLNISLRMGAFEGKFEGIMVEVFVNNRSKDSSSISEVLASELDWEICTKLMAKNLHWRESPTGQDHTVRLLNRYKTFKDESWIQAYDPVACLY